MIPVGIIGMAVCTGDSAGDGILGGLLLGAGAGEILIGVGVTAGDILIMDTEAITLITDTEELTATVILTILPEEEVVLTIMVIEELPMEEITLHLIDTALPEEATMVQDIQQEPEILQQHVQQQEPEINQVVIVIPLVQIQDLQLLQQLLDPPAHLLDQVIILQEVPEVPPVVVLMAEAEADQAEAEADQVVVEVNSTFVFSTYLFVTRF